MSKPRIALVGSAGHARVALDAARCQDRYEVVGFLDSYAQAGTPVAGLRVLGRPDQIDALAVEHRLDGFFLGISDNCTRAAVCEKIRAMCPGLELVSLIHPASTVARDVTPGAGTLILAGAIVNTGSTVGVNCIINTRSSLDHDSEMMPYSSILPGVTTGGDVVIGEYSCICLGANIGHKVKIGEHTVVGAGSVVLSDLPPYSLVYGVPARVARSRKAGERHF